nr:PilC/PilY family type IV pilus protein [Marinobacter sp. S6332]
MVTFGVGLGVEGEIDAKTAFDAILDDSISVTWPSTDSDSGKVDDLLHAAVNGRGGFFNAADPDTFATKLAAVLSDIVSRVEESSTSAAASSAVLREDALSFSAGFRSTDWSGALQAAEILPGGARGRLIWDAEYGLESKGANGRNLYTYSAGAGVELKAIGNLSSAQESALNTATDGSVDDLGQARINWLRGDNAADSSFRDRLYVPSAAGGVSRLRLLGDVIGSDPQFAGKTNFGHRRLAGTEGSSYATYRASADYQDRPDVIYVGANDGYLHGFDSLTGEELFAYMPSELIQPDDGSNFAKINVLMESDYDHKYFVDGTPVIQDVYVDGQWKTILVGTMGVGGKTVFALDVSDPKNFSEADVLWEFTNSELGYGVESPQIAKLESGKWVAIFGNGYNSASNKSSLFVVDVSDGSLVARMDTGAGEADTPNGMSTPSVLVDQSTGLAKTAYVGDLLGNLWRADLTAGSLSAGSAISKLFSATSTDDTKQPITSAPSFARNPNGGPNDLVIVFGTGSYFRVTDSGDNQTQSLYGIFDNGSVSGIDRGDLLKQTITDETSTTYKVDKDGTLVPVEIDVRVVSAKEFVGTEDGWFMDLDKIAGERIVSSPSFPSGYPVERVRFSTLIPDNNDCGGGVDGYLMDMDLATGGQTEDPVFDLNRDGEFNESDNTVKNEKGESVGAGQGDGEGESSVVSGIRGVVSGEEIRVVLDNKTDLFVESVIVDLPNDYDGPVDPPTDPTPDDGDSEDPEDPEEPTTCQGPACGAAEGYNFGRQNWEELR